MWPTNDQLIVEVSRKATVGLGFELWDEVNQSPIDITGYSVRCEVSLTDGGDVLETIQPEMSSPKNGQFSIVFDGRKYNDVPGAQDIVNLSYIVTAESDSDGPVQLIKSVIVLKP